jgi:hypothetical protein
MKYYPEVIASQNPRAATCQIITEVVGLRVLFAPINPPPWWKPEVII